MNPGLTLADKLWNSHVVAKHQSASDLLYIDLHLVHEVTSPQAFDGLELSGRVVRRPDLTLAVEDHNVATDLLQSADPIGQEQLKTLRENCSNHGIELYSVGDDRQGIVHVVGPQLGAVQPGMSVVCGDSHTSTHGAFGALAFGIGTSDVEHVLATQTLPFERPKTMAVEFVGDLPDGVVAKDLILAFIAEVGPNGAQGHSVEYRGHAVRALSMESRMTMCNMSVEAGARFGVIEPDEATYEYLKGRPYSPTGDRWEQAVKAWNLLRTDEDAAFSRTVTIDVSTLSPHVTWGTQPGQAIPLDSFIPHPEEISDPSERRAAVRALDYMGLEPGTPMQDIEVDTVFIGSCTNGRIEDLRSAAQVMQGRQLAPGLRMLVVPGSMEVRHQAEEEGLHEVFRSAGAEWRLPGCSICLGMNSDRLSGGQRVASTSNRNFEGRQGNQVRTHLVSPGVAAATAITGFLSSPSKV